MKCIKNFCCMKALCYLLLISNTLAADEIRQISSPIGIRSVIDNSGRVVTVWEAVCEGISIIQSNTLYSSGVWEGVTTLSDLKLYGSKPEIAGDEEGNIIAVWRVNNHLNQTDFLVVATLPVGGKWSSPSQISTENQFGIDEYHIKASSAGVFMVTWKSYDKGTQLPQYTAAKFQFGSSDSSGSWTIHEDIFPAP